MELEIGKRYHITPVVVSPCLLSEGYYIVSHVGYSLGLRFQVTGDSIKEARPVSSYTFTRLPSFGDEVEVSCNGKISHTWKHYYYLGENEMAFFVSFHNKKRNFSSAVYTDCFLKAEHTIKLFTPASETTTVLGKTYLTTDVQSRIAELTPLGD